MGTRARRSGLVAAALAAIVATAMTAAPTGADVKRSWRDDFDRLDTNTWNVVDRACFDPANVAVSGGKLRMTIAETDRPDCYGVAGARINTYDRREFAPGIFEARIKFVLAPGSWQTFWLTGAGPEEFPANGEVDVAEVIGRTPTQTHVALHSAFKTGGTRRCDLGGAPEATVDRVWHRYSVTTSATRVTFAIDGVPIASYAPGGPCTWPFGDQLRMLFSSRGGQYGGEVDLAAYPVTYLVDWVSWRPY